MKRIHKSVSPDFFENWKKEYKDRSGRDATYSDLIGEPKQQLKITLHDEQYGLCCYCCKALSEPYPNNDSINIEHFKPKGNSLYEKLSLDYNNLHISCSGYKDQRENCGHKKDEWFDEMLTVSPMEENVEKLFTYTIDGHIKASAGNIRADTTIQKLGLDSFALQRLRNTAIFICGLFDADYDDEKKEYILREHRTPQNGRLKSFCNAVAVQ